MRKNNIREIFRERWKFYLVGYILGYIISLIYYGVPNYLYIIPIKLIAIISGILIGTALYYGKQRVTVVNSAYKSLKYMLLSIIIMVIFVSLQKLLIKYGVDITPFNGFSAQ